MGGIGKALGKVLDVVKPFVTMINPLAGMALGLASDLMQGKNPLQSLLSAATDLIPGGGVFKNLMGAFGGSGLLDGAGGNSLLSGALNLATGQGKITDVLGDLMKGASGAGGLSDLGMSNAAELTAQRMAQTLLA
jgi:hypothetical protein